MRVPLTLIARFSDSHHGPLQAPVLHSCLSHCPPSLCHYSPTVCSYSCSHPPPTTPTGCLQSEPPRPPVRRQETIPFQLVPACPHLGGPTRPSLSLGPTNEFQPTSGPEQRLAQHPRGLSLRYRRSDMEGNTHVTWPRAFIRTQTPEREREFGGYFSLVSSGSPRFFQSSLSISWWSILHFKYSLANKRQFGAFSPLTSLMHLIYSCICFVQSPS